MAPPRRGLRGRLIDLLFGGRPYQWTLRGRTPTRLAVSPGDPWPGSVDVGRTLMAPDVSFAAGSPPIGSDGSDPHVFAWLRDLHAVGSDAARARARELIGEWEGRYGRWDAAAWRADVVARRLTNWLRHYAFVGRGAEDGFGTMLLDSMARQARHLARFAGGAPMGASRISAAKGLIYAGACLPDGKKHLREGLKLLDAELVRQILPDGGHIQRNPLLQLSVLRDLVDIRAVLTEARQESPRALPSAIDRMAPMLRFFRHGDGGLALFNGSDESDTFLDDLVLSEADAPGRPPNNARHVGFQRLANGKTLVLVDTGLPPPSGFDEGAHAGTLSFEMSVGEQRLIVNCGAMAARDPGWRAGQRATAAHSTLIVADTNSSEVLASGGLGRRPSAVPCSRNEADGAIWMDAKHDGYAANFGLTHQRRLYLAADGADLRGEDRLTGARKGQPFAVRFHLHPDIDLSAPSLGKDGAIVELRPPTGRAWRLQAAGGEVSIEDSVYLGHASGVAETRQIVVRGTTASGGGNTVSGDGDAALVRWAIRRVS